MYTHKLLPAENNYLILLPENMSPNTNELYHTQVPGVQHVTNLPFLMVYATHPDLHHRQDYPLCTLLVWPYDVISREIFHS